jgi:hypothetical protein
MRRNTLIALAGVLVFGAACLVWQGSAGGQVSLGGEPGIGHLMAGTYYGQACVAVCFPHLTTLTADGCVTGVTGCDYGNGGPAAIVYDLFHVVAKYGREVIDKVRVAEAKRHTNRGER